MALAPSYDIDQQDGGLIAIATNTTVYGAPNQNRNDAAEYVLWSKTAQDSVRTFYNPDQGNVLTNLVYSLQTAIDGWYELIRLRIQFYDDEAQYVPEESSGGAVTQYASIFYYATTGKVYKAIVDSLGQDPESTNYFTEVPLSEMGDILANTNIDVYYLNFYCEYRTNVCIRDKDDSNCGCANKDDDYINGLYAMKQSADTNFANDNPEIMEKIIRELENTCTQC